MVSHQYVQRYRNLASDEKLLADQILRFLYHREREQEGFLQAALASKWVTDALAHWQFDRRLSDSKKAIEYAAHRLMIRESESVNGFTGMKTLRDLFERQIRYWEVRPMPNESRKIVSPADGKLLPFAANDRDVLPIKSKFLRIDELLGGMNPWVTRALTSIAPLAHDRAIFAPLSGAIVRLTPDVYHYTHTPVSGKVLLQKTIEGRFHSCNPTALTRLTGSYALNRRTITVYDTDVPDGTQVGIVTQIDVAAMMIGCMEPRYSPQRYESPRAVQVGEIVPRGAPLSLFRPGSSTSIVLWDASRAMPCKELVANSRRRDLRSRFTDWLREPWVETEVRVRQAISD